jgi:hypothetical protein
MYTLGTSAIKYLADNTALPQNIRDALVSKLVGYVGTVADMVDSTDYPAVFASNYAIFFALPAVDPSGTEADKHTIAPINQLTVASVYNCEDFAWDTTPIGTLNFELITTVLLPASTFTNAIYKVQRGLYSDIGSALKEAGAQYFAKDLNELFIYNELDGKYVSVTGGIIGMIMIWPQFMPVPVGYLRCDGAIVSQTQYPRLYSNIGHNFDYGTVPAGMFTLPTQDNAIVRYA